MVVIRATFAAHSVGWRVLAMGWLMVWLVAPALGANLFRYKNEDGIEVLSYTIPNSRVQYGYEIVDTQGNVIERVSPQLSIADYNAKLAREAAVAECEKMRERVRKLYQVEADVDYAEQQSLASIDQAISNLQANLNVATAQLQEFEKQAGQLDISGKQIPGALLDNIARAAVQVENFDDELQQRLADKQAAHRTHEYERQIFLLDDCADGLPPQMP